MARRPTAAVGVGLALAPTSNRISCDFTADGRLIESSCVNADTGVHTAMMAILIVVALIPPIVVATYLYWTAGRHTAAA